MMTHPLVKSAGKLVQSTLLPTFSLGLYCVDFLPRCVSHWFAFSAFIGFPASKFAAKQIYPLVAKMDRQGFMEPSLIQELFQAGLMGIEIPADFGGSNLDFVSSLIVVEEISKVDPSVAILVDIQNTLIVTLLKRLGTVDQKEQWLPRLARDTVGSFCLSEADSGSDAFSLRTIATKDGSDYVISGCKTWISNSHEAGLFVVMANANPSSSFSLLIFCNPFSLGFKVSFICVSGLCPINKDNAYSHEIPFQNI
ncbi:unnamed protein product [Echinostoma caproni]|uniref:Short/branched chain specific acyl-CoA dehydrogenase, mitochondrial n=1 Tax=Echinostoma caproni TaxID=27848 RepID=A0A183B645_9TREM|nr:unnamed protein product [Echinostoma caproni]